MTDYLEPLAPPPEPPGTVVLEVRDLHTSFSTEAGLLRAVNGVSFDVCSGEVLGVVGESGCGKSVTAMSIMGLLPRPAGRIESGQILFKGDDLVSMKPRERRAIAGDRISMVFQDPLTALNPVYRIGTQISELIRAHREVSRKEAWARAVELLGLVGIPNPADRARDYPHQFSGGMRQRAVIAMAIALNPDLLIADEPTTALDVTVQAQILEVLLRVRDQLGMAIMLITHDLGVVAEVAERVMVMYAGEKVEEAAVDMIFERPKHPYTWGLLAATTRADRPAIARLYQITGAPPSLLHPPPACRFAPRCPHVQAVCREHEPELCLVGDSHEAACHFADQAGWGPQREPAAVANITYESAAE